MPKPPCARRPGLCAPTVRGHAKGFGQKPRRGGRTAWTAGGPHTSWPLTAQRRPLRARRRSGTNGRRPVRARQGAPSQHTTSRSVLARIRRRAPGCGKGVTAPGWVCRRLTHRLALGYTADAPPWSECVSWSATVRRSVCRNGLNIPKSGTRSPPEAIPTPQRRRRTVDHVAEPHAEVLSMGQSPTPRRSTTRPETIRPRCAGGHHQVARVVRDGAARRWRKPWRPPASTRERRTRRTAPPPGGLRPRASCRRSASRCAPQPRTGGRSPATSHRAGPSR